MADATTSKFGLLKPALGSYFGSWHTPVNLNMDKIDAALQDIRTHYKTAIQSDITEEGRTWYNTALKTFYLNNGTTLVSLITSDKFVITDVDMQTALIAGVNSVTDLHAHPGYSDHFFRVKNPELASTTNELANKQYYAVPFKLFDDNRTATNSTLTNHDSRITTQTNKLGSISPSGTDLTVGSISASGIVGIDRGLQVKYPDGNLIKLGVTSASGSYDVVTTKNIPVNFKTTDAGSLEIQVNGQKVWTLGNQGSGSGMDSDKVDNCHVNDGQQTTSNLWTAQKVADAILAAIQSMSEISKANTLGNVGGPYHDAAYFATAQSVIDHKSSADHDNRYVKPDQLFNVPIGGTIVFDVDFVQGGISNFDGNGTGLINTPLAGWQICNGYTPAGSQGIVKDLRDRFVLGSGPNAKIANVGGTGGVQTYAIRNDQLPIHAHFFCGDDELADGRRGVQEVITADEVTTAHNLGHAKITQSVDYDSESRSGGGNGYKTMEFQDRGKEVNNMPPYYAMIYIVRYK